MNTLVSIKKNWEFQKIFCANNSVHTKYLSMYFLKTESWGIGIAVSKKFAKAVVRNFIKRQVKYILRKRSLRLEGHGVVLLVKQRFCGLSFRQKEQEVLRVFKVWHDKKHW